MNKPIKNTYQGQALAIAMVILVVSSLIGVSVYSRSMKDKGLTLEERASAEALEVSDVILDKLTYYPIDDVIAGINSMNIDGGDEPFDASTGIVIKENNTEEQISQLLWKVGALAFESKISDLMSPICPIGIGSNEYQLSLKEADSQTFYEVRPGHVWAFPVKNIESSCTLNMKFSVRGDTRAGFIISYLYCKYNAQGNVESCKEYGPADVESYCFADDSGCNNTSFLDSENWNKYIVDAGGFGTIVPVDLNSQIDEYNISEVRVKAVGGTVGVNSTTVGCTSVSKMYQLRATANCSGVYRGKEILIPQTKWHNTLFDYVLFNGQGGI